MTKFKEWNIGSIDLLVGGTPCQSFSVAGLRKGLDDPRGNLMLTYLAIADQYRPRWLVWENVPGVLSSNGGKDFGVFLGALGELGYGFAYRVLDAQYFGVAQRRRRVFVVGYLGDWRAAAAVLFERHSLSGDSAPSREKRKEVAGGTGDGARVSGLCARTGLSNSVQDAVQGHLLPIALQDITSRGKAQNGKGWNADGSAYTVDTHATQGVAHPIPVGYSIREDAKANTFSATELNVSTALKALQPGVQSHHAQTFVAQPISFSGQMSEPQTDVDMTQTLQAKNPMAVAQSMAVRRLTPVECERLQGFPDNYTDIQPKGKATPDGPRYKALGNSMAVPVMAWIGKRIQEVENLQCKPNK
jgi:DNA (cytosine-5)-methyltransferase 1